ncbi:MAG: CRTAC1 family protein, partial [Planctomycetota bacterium]
LFVNRGDGTFEDRAAALNCADLNPEGRGVSMGSVFGDFDNDGDEDLFVYRFGYPALLRNDGDAGFVEVTRAAGLERWANSNGAIWFDYDRDGWLDLYLLGYYRPEHDLWDLSTTRIMHDSGEFATNGAPNWLFRNNGDGTFEDVSARVGLTSEQWSYAALAADLDRDGWPDLYVANDYGSEELFRNVEGQRFEPVDADLQHDSKSGMSVSIGNVRNDGRWSLFITNISERGYIFHGNNLRLNRVDDAGRLIQQARGALVDTGWAWGAQFGDLDLDGFQDLVVVNGFVSGDPKRSYWYDAGKLSGGIGGLLADAANWPAFEGRSQSGYQRTAVLLNGGRGTFSNVATAAGIDDLYDGRAVALADIDSDGDLDLLIANQKGPLLCYRNETEGGGWIGFELEATRSNRSAIGAEVELTFDGARQLQVVTGGSGFSSQNDRRVHFGVGQDARQLSAVVRWPSGAEQRLEGLEPGAYVHVVEPSPADETPSSP